MTDTQPVRSVDYKPAASNSRDDRNSSNAALQALEEALAGPAPGRNSEWLQRVMAALDHFEAALATQGRTDGETSSLMSEIANNEPRLLPRIERLRDEYEDIVISLRSLRNQITLGAGEDGDGVEGIDVADIRDRLSSVARRYRQHRSREADLVYEAVTIDLGAGD